MLPNFFRNKLQPSDYQEIFFEVFLAAPLNHFSEARFRDTKKPGTFTSSGPNENMICIYYEGILFLKAAPSRIGKRSTNA